MLKVGARNSVAIGSGGGKAIGTVAFFKENAFIPDHRTLANGNEPMVMGNPPFVDDVSSRKHKKTVTSPYHDCLAKKVT